MRSIHRQHHLLVAAAIALGLITASCGGGATSTTESSATTVIPSETPAQAPATQSGSGTGGDNLTVKTCDLWTIDEVEAAIGALSAPPEYDGSAPPMYTCSYTSQDVDLNVGAFVYPDEETAKELFQTAIDSGSATRIDGPGDEAQSNQPTGDVTVRSGRIELSIDLFSSLSLDQELEIAKDLAAMAVPRLP